MLATSSSSYFCAWFVDVGVDMDIDIEIKRARKGVDFRLAH